MLPIIPAEIYVEILSFFEPSDYGLSDRESRYCLMALAQVSHWFRSYLLPLLFRSLNIVRPPTGCHSIPSMQFCAGLHDSASAAHVRAVELAALVVECKIHFLPVPTEHSYACLGICVDAFSYFSNLRCLVINGIKVEDYFLEALSYLENLDSLSIYHCYFDDSDRNQTGVEIIPLKLTSFDLSLRPIDITGTNPLLSVTRLVSAVSPTLKSLSTTDIGFAIDVMANPVDYCISKLVLPLEIWAVPIFRDFLKRTPSITSITFRVFALPYPTPPLPSLNLPPSTLPLLEHISGPGCVITHLIPGRPVKKVELSAPNFGLFAMPNLDRAIAVLGRSTATAIEHLEIPSPLVISRDILLRINTLSLMVCDNLANCDVSLHCNP